MNKVNIGGDRLGSGNKMNVAMHGYERSTHDLSYLWKSTMAPGTLVPFMSLVALPGDTFDIDLDCIMKTAPTVGPLFGSFKIQLDVFTCPIRLYNRQLHNNKLGIGMDMSKVKFPAINIFGPEIDLSRKTPAEFQQINQSSLLAYLGYRGVAGSQTIAGATTVGGPKNAIPLLAYWDIFKNYYCNKQEELAYAIFNEPPSLRDPASYPEVSIATPFTITTVFEQFFVYGTDINIHNIQINTAGGWIFLTDAVETSEHWPFQPGVTPSEIIYITKWKQTMIGIDIIGVRIDLDASLSQTKPNLTSFDPKDIDNMRDLILSAPNADIFDVTATNMKPYRYSTIIPTGMPLNMSSVIGQAGLAVKTYQSDIYNNWLSEENFTAITNVTSIDTSGGSFSIDTLNLSKKVYDMLNRIAISGGSYQDWLSAVYDEKSKWRAESPVYQGGLSKELVFQEVVSQSATENEPLGSLAGKGIMTKKHKGGSMVINIDEPSYIMGIISITPRLDYSQGNNWDINLKTMDDLHKPGLDGIGFQELITDGMAFWDTQNAGDSLTYIYKRAGYQPAWLNYMTNHNKTYGNFADPRSQMFMTLDRRYQPVLEGGSIVIEDLTTYIDPAKFNYAFAQIDSSAMNFWAQVGVNITARRKMSAKIIPNL